jgi:hypothetical protein
MQKNIYAYFLACLWFASNSGKSLHGKFSIARFHLFSISSSMPHALRSTLTFILPATSRSLSIKMVIFNSRKNGNSRAVKRFLGVPMRILVAPITIIMSIDSAMQVKMCFVAEEKIFYEIRVANVPSAKSCPQMSVRKCLTA